jgi:hypothetical protein
MIAATLTFALTLLAPAAPSDRSEVVLEADPAAREPQVAVDGRGRVFVAYGVGDEVRLAASADGGSTFAGPVTVGRVPHLSLGMRRGPRIAATDDAVVVTAIGGPTGGGRDGDLFAWRSTDAGQTWAGPTRVNTVEASAREGLHGMAARGDGTVFVTWLDLRSGKMELFGARSTDAGATWEPDQRLYRSPDGPICQCCHPSAAFAADGSLVVAWRNALAGARDMYAIRSEDGGRSFEPAEKLGRRTWLLDACPMDGGAVAFDRDGRPTPVWTRADQVFLGGEGSERLLGDGVQPWAATSGSGVHALWLRKRSGPLRYLAPGVDEPTTLDDSANDPVVASGPGGRGPVVAAWERSEGDRTVLVVRVLEPGI